MLELALGVSGLGVWEWDIAADREVWSPEQARLFGFPPDTAVGSVETFLSLLHPDDAEPVRENLRRAIEAGDAELEGEFRIFRKDTGEMRWFQGRARAYPDPVTGRAARIVGVNGDITDRKRAEERRQFLDGLFERTRTLLDSEDLIEETVRSVGEFLGLSRYLYAEIDTDAGTTLVHQDWCAPGVRSLVGAWPLADWGSVRDELAAERTAIFCRTGSGGSSGGGFHSSDVRAVVAVPLFRGGRWVAVFSAHMVESSRDWTDDEVELLETVARQMWLVFEKARLYQQARRDEERFRALVMAASQIVWRTGPDGLLDDLTEWRSYTGQTSEQIRGLGWRDALHPDDRSRVTADWISAVERREVYDCEYRVRGADGTYRWFAARGVPLFEPDGSLREYIGTLLDIDARRRLEETQARFLAEQQRIATTLQRSMLMTAPTATLPADIEVETFYEPASDEADVGGDFFDVFALDEADGTPGAAVALVVGDVTGKGLEAAAYTAEVKYALRALLREYPNPGIALERLNNFLIDSRRLDRRGIGSLVSLAVVVAHPSRGEALAAVAGAEPPLYAASDASPRETPVSGLMLGVMPKVRYETVTLPFQPGDLLALTTDGITESRDPSRRTFFGYAGFTEAVAASLPAETLGAVSDAIVTAARAYSGGELSDDVCLLVARRTPV